MDKLKITGGKRLSGELLAPGAKNAVLPMLAATILTESICNLTNVPDLRDVQTFIKLLNILGADARFNKNTAIINSSGIKETVAPYDLVKTMRASILVLGPLLARFGEAKISLPGGCAIGARPIDQHLKGLEKMGAKIELIDGYVLASVDGRLKGSTIVMDLVTVTGTANLLMASTLAEGETILENAAREPEIDDLANMLICMGAKIEGVGTSRLVINGAASLDGCEYEVMPDRIVCATYLVAAVMTGGDVFVRGARSKDLESALSKLNDVGAYVHHDKNGIRVSMNGSNYNSVDILTQPHPGFPTDLQAQFMSLNALSSGSSTIEETIFENRFMHVPELIRMGADIHINGHTATVKGVRKLNGAPVMATDLRASASLVLAGLAAEGETTIDRIYHLDRGYESIEKCLNQLGASVERIKSDDNTL